MRKIKEEFGKLWDLNAVWDFLTPDEKDFIDQHTETKFYRKNETIYNEGDTFSYRSAMAGDCHSTSATALEPAVLYYVERDAFLTVIQKNIKFCYAVLVAMSKDLGLSETQTVNLTQKHIRGRLAESLLALRKTYGYDEDGATIAMYMAREDLANMSNMTTSNAIRTLSQFASENLIALDGRKIKLLNESELTRISRLG